MNQKTYKLQIAIAGGGIWGVTTAGFLSGLQERSIVPEIITGISSGFHAAFVTYTVASHEGKIFWFKQIRDQLEQQIVHNRFSRFLPPYDRKAEAIWEWSQHNLVDPKVFKDQGIEKFYVGYTNLLRGLKFEAVDLIELDSYDAWRMVIRTCMIPFATIAAPTFEGCLDGGIRKAVFLVDEPCDYKLGLGYIKSPRIDKKKFDRFVYLPRCAPFFLNATETQLKKGFEQGYEIGLKINL